MYPLLKDKHIPRKCKVVIYESILKPILMYGSFLWSLSSETESRLQGAEMRLVRLIGGVNIEQELSIVPLLEDIERGKLRCYGEDKKVPFGTGSNFQRFSPSSPFSSTHLHIYFYIQQVT